jgi:hypothetical protein
MTVSVVNLLEEVNVADEKGNGMEFLLIVQQLFICILVVVVEAHSVFQLRELIVHGVIEECFRLKRDAADESGEGKLANVLNDVEFTVIVKLVDSLICADELAFAVGNRHNENRFCNIACLFVYIGVEIGVVVGIVCNDGFFHSESLTYHACAFGNSNSACSHSGGCP